MRAHVTPHVHQHLVLSVFLTFTNLLGMQWSPIVVLICDSLMMVGGLPIGTAGKESAFHAGDTGDLGLIPESGRSPGGGNGNQLQSSCLENPMDERAWWAAV